MSLIDTYQLATGGQNSDDTFTLASNGILIDITVTPLPPSDIPSGGGGLGDLKWTKSREDEEEKKDRKKVTVVVTIKGQKYTETLIVEDRPKLTAKDVNVEVIPTTDKPKIKITF